MKPQKVTIEGERDERKIAMCNTIIDRAARMMVEEVEAPLPMMLDRLLTYSAAQMCVTSGSAKASEVFRLLADQIATGVFHSVTGENLRSEDRH